eukprot:scaffold9752_cov103-Isochrysis_galbana.AAC.5
MVGAVTAASLPAYAACMFRPRAASAISLPRAATAISAAAATAVAAILLRASLANLTSVSAATAIKVLKRMGAGTISRGTVPAMAMPSASV